MAKSFNKRAKELLSAAKKKAPECESWADLSNHIFGVDGLFVKMFPTLEERQAFTKLPECGEIRQLMVGLPRTAGEPADSYSGKTVLRMPASLHAALAAEAEVEGVSLNQLLVTKLSVQLSSAVGM